MYRYYLYFYIICSIRPHTKKSLVYHPPACPNQSASMNISLIPFFVYKIQQRRHYTSSANDRNHFRGLNRREQHKFTESGLRACALDLASGYCERLSNGCLYKVVLSSFEKKNRIFFAFFSLWPNQINKENALISLCGTQGLVFKTSAIKTWRLTTSIVRC